MSKPHEVEDNKEYLQSSDTDVSASKKAAAKLRKKCKQKTVADHIDEAAWFYFLYGLLDGLSVSYSTLKYLCEITTGSSKEYGEALETALSDPEWLALVVTGSVLITGISALSNYFDKTEKKALKKDPTKKQTKIFWEYARDILKGAKNGYKGTKGFIAMFLALEVLDKAQFASILLPIGLVISAVSILNRCWQRGMTDERDKRQKRSKDATKKVQKLNEFLQKKQDIKNELFALEQKIMRAEQLEQLLKELQNDVAELTPKVEALPQREGLTLETEEKASGLIKNKSQSTPCLTKHDFNEQTYLVEITEEHKKLLTAPEIEYYSKNIQELQEVIRKQNVPLNEEKHLHPLLEKLNRQKKNLEDLENKQHEKRTFTLEELREKHEAKYKKLKELINQQKRQDTVTLTKAILDKQEYVKDLRPDVDALLNEWDAEQRETFLATTKSLYEKFEEQNDEIARLDKEVKEVFEQQKLSEDEQDEKFEDTEKQKKTIEQEKKRLIEELFLHFTQNGIDESLIKDFDAAYSFKELENSRESLATYRDETKDKLLWSKVIGAFADAPYLYAGILGIVLVSPPGALLWVLTSAIIAFSVTAIFTRRNEEQEDDHKCQQILIENELSKLHNEWKDAQNQYYKKHAKVEEYKKAYPTPNEEQQKELTKRENERKEAARHAVKIYNQTQEKRKELKEHLKPTDYNAIMNGLKDGLTLFGAIASLFYAINIALIIAGSTFPPALIIGAIAFGAAAMIFRAGYRYWHAKQKRQEIDKCFHIQKANEDELQNNKPSLVLGMEDCNTDGFTKGELILQEGNEFARVLGSTAGKSQNLWNFLLDGVDRGFALILGCSLAVTYTTVLLARAWAKCFKTKGDAAEKKQESNSQSKQDTSQKGPEPFESDQPPSRRGSANQTTFKSLADNPRQSPTFFSSSLSPDSSPRNRTSSLRESPYLMFPPAPSPEEAPEGVVFTSSLTG